MDPLQRTIWCTAFAAGFLVAYGLLLYWEARRQARMRCRHPGTMPAGASIGPGETSPLKQRLVHLLTSFGHWALRGGRVQGSQARESLIRAGFRHPHALSVYYGIRALGAMLLPLPYLIIMAMTPSLTFQSSFTLISLIATGFYLPHFLLGLKARRRQDRLDKALPEVLDLCIVCMEAGLALQATINRVAEEIHQMSPDFYQELQLTSAELRTGLPREAAFLNLAERTGVASIKSLVSLMIQSDKMGTSISEALRLHADFIRERRFLKAEEKAAKLAVKILFPLFLFIFPVIFIIILGPAVIQISKRFSM